MTINAIGCSPVNYSQSRTVANRQNIAFAGKEVSNPEKGKKFGKGAASFFMTGLGQMLDGRIKTGFKQLGVEAGLGAVSGLATALAIKAMSTGSRAGMISAIGLSIASGIGVIVNKARSVIDAYKGGK